MLDNERNAQTWQIPLFWVIIVSFCAIKHESKSQPSAEWKKYETITLCVSCLYKMSLDFLESVHWESWNPSFTGQAQWLQWQSDSCA